MSDMFEFAKYVAEVARRDKQIAELERQRDDLRAMIAVSDEQVSLMDVDFKNLVLQLKDFAFFVSQHSIDEARSYAEAILKNEDMTTQSFFLIPACPFCGGLVRFEAGEPVGACIKCGEDISSIEPW